jgi:NAD(P)-dependent dehydrogenase (short-subunit alcohol dehydrogenase family)
MAAYTGPQRAAAMLAQQGALVTLCSRTHDRAASACEAMNTRFKLAITPAATPDLPAVENVLQGAQIVMTTGAAGIELVCPADLTGAELADLQEQSVRAFEALGAAGLARVDFFLTDTGLVLNEINTMPGFTPISMFPRCWQETGLAYPDLIDELIQVALAHRGR